MNIRRAHPSEREAMHDVWLRSVRATHDFVLEEDIQMFIPMVHDYLASEEAAFWVIGAESGEIMGFMGMSGSKIDAIFMSPEYLRCGGGRAFVNYARSMHDELTVDVNEQNTAACKFYEACGFVVESRSELDDLGRPYPLLHMRWVKSEAL